MLRHILFISIICFGVSCDSAYAMVREKNKTIAKNVKKQKELPGPLETLAIMKGVISSFSYSSIDFPDYFDGKFLKNMENIVPEIAWDEDLGKGFFFDDLSPLPLVKVFGILNESLQLTWSIWQKKVIEELIGKGRKKKKELVNKLVNELETLGCLVNLLNVYLPDVFVAMRLKDLQKAIPEIVWKEERLTHAQLRDFFDIQFKYLQLSWANWQKHLAKAVKEVFVVGLPF